jgi:GNAT superfamily N-acetyltransferase
MPSRSPKGAKPEALLHPPPERQPLAARVRAAYDAQLRGHTPAALLPGETLERDGPLLRYRGGPVGRFVLYRDLDGLDGPELDALIARQVAAFARHGEGFEWKYHGHDLPRDLPERLLAADLVPQPTETVMIAPVSAIAGEPVLPEGVTLREFTDRRDFDRIGELERAVWGHDDGLPEMLAGEHAADPGAITIVVAEAADTVVCAGWIRLDRRTEFGTLWGGATLSEWRRRGIYRATVAYRANVAAGRGFRYLETDASDDSRPILERLGFVAVTTTTPYFWSPPVT